MELMLASTGVDRDLKRGRDPEPRSAADGPRQRKKRNRWGDASENKAAGLMGLPTAIMSNMTSEQLEAYTLHLAHRGNQPEAAHRRCGPSRR